MPAAAPKAVNPMIIYIVQTVLTMLQNCPEPTPAKRRARLRKPKRAHKMLVTLKALKAGYKLDDINAAWTEVDAMVAEATDADLDAFMAQAA